MQQQIITRGLLLVLLLLVWGSGATSCLPNQEVARSSSILFDWLESKPHGSVQRDHIDIRCESETGLGIYAKEDLQRDQVIFSIPLSAMMNIEHAVASEPLGGYIESNTWWPDADALGVFVLHEIAKKENSSWAPYLAMLPGAIATPFRFTTAHWEELQASPFRAYAKDLQTRMMAVRDEVLALPDFPLSAEFLSQERYAFAVSLVHSRIFSVKVKDSKGAWQKTKSLVPLADLLNSADEPNVECYTNADSTAFECRAKKFVLQGEQLYGAYASYQGSTALPNGMLLLDYGFTVPNNWNDFVRVELERGMLERLPKAFASLSNHKTFQITHDAIPSTMLGWWRVVSCLEHSMMPASPFVSFVKLSLPSERRDIAAYAAEFQSSYRFAPYRSCEQRVLKMLRNKFGAMLVSYGTTVAEDEALLASPAQLDVDMLNVIRVRVGEKRVLVAWKGMLDALLGHPNLMMEDKEL